MVGHSRRCFDTISTTVRNYVITIRYLKLSQIFYRLLVIFKPITKVTPQAYELRAPSNLWVPRTRTCTSIDGEGNASFLNQTIALKFPGSWADPNLSKLWLYNLHYFDDFLSLKNQDCEHYILTLYSRWIDENKSGSKPGWESYPTSQRISNILIAYLNGVKFRPDHLASIAMQAEFLRCNLERHLLGNHFFLNLKALLFAGVVLQIDRFVALSTRELVKELDEQILEDGGNFEWSPMYHYLMLVDVLDMINLGKSFEHCLDEELQLKLEHKAEAMLRFAEQVTHPDGYVGHFNDSVAGIAPSLDEIRSYAVKLGVPRGRDDSSKLATLLPNTGFSVLKCNDIKVIFDCGDVGPSYLPGHAHAQSLSFEVSVGLDRIIVNSGISRYGECSQRLYERSTAAHSTVEVNRQNSSNVWGGFRVADRAKVGGRVIIKSERSVGLVATHDGYSSVFRNIEHSRSISVGHDWMHLFDRVTGDWSTATVRLFFDPAVKVVVENDMLTLESANYVIKANLCGMEYSLKSTEYYPEFGRIKKNKCLEIFMCKPTNSILFYFDKISQ